MALFLTGVQSVFQAANDFFPFSKELYISNPISVEPQRTALLLMDFQEFALKNFLPETAASDVVTCATKLLASAREARILVVHITVNFRHGYPEISPRNKMFCWLRDSGLIEPGSDGTAINAALSPTEREPVIAKHRIGAFMGTDLDRILRAQGIQTLICAGVTTSGVVLSTVRQAFDLDYELIVVRDGCADTDNEVHDFLVDRIISHHAVIKCTDEVEQILNKSIGPDLARPSVVSRLRPAADPAAAVRARP